MPLAGVRVVDFSWAVAGPVTTKLLALFGAEVIKIESRVRIDGGRLGTPFLEGKPGINKSGYFANHNTSKRSIRLDLSKPEAKEIAKRLAAVADVVAESFSAGVIERHGLGYEELCKVKADLVMISLTMQGQTGPFASHVGFGRTLAGLAGFDHLTGWPASNPAGPNQPYTDLVVPWFAASAVVSALRRRDRTGQGPIPRPLPTRGGAPLPRAVAARLHRQRQRPGARRQSRPRRGAARRLPLRRR